MYENQVLYPTGIHPVQQRNIDYIKQYFKKPVNLVLAIVYAIAIAFSIFISISATNSLLTFAQEFQPYSFQSSYNTDITQFSSILGAISGSIFEIIFLAGLFIVYFKSKNPDPHSTPSSGFTILYVFAIIKLIAAIALAALFLLACGILLIVAIAEQESDMIIATSVFSVLFVIIIIPTLIYSIATFKFTSSIRKGLNTPAPVTAKGATVLLVFNVIFAVFSLISALSVFTLPSFINLIASEMSSYEYYTIKPFFDQMSSQYIYIFISALPTIIIYVLYAIICAGYKKHINNYEQTIYTTAGNTYFQQPYANYQQQPYVNYQQQPQQPYTDFGQQIQQPQANNTFENNNIPETPQNDTSANSTTVESNNSVQDGNISAKDTAKCPKCGFLVNADDKFCEQCGFKIE